MLAGGHRPPSRPPPAARRPSAPLAARRPPPASEPRRPPPQTDRPPRDAEALAALPKKYERESQTAIVQTRSQQSVREAGTQMEVGHVSVEEGVDRVLRPLPYFDSEMVAALRLEKAIDIQRYTRGWFARSAAIALLTTQAAEEVAMAEAEEAQRAAAEERHKREIQRRMHPQSYEDFEILYNELEAWRLQETARINDECADDEAARRAELTALLTRSKNCCRRSTG